MEERERCRGEKGSNKSLRKECKKDEAESTGRKVENNEMAGRFHG